MINKEKLNIMLAINSLGIGGMDKHLQIFAENINKKHFNVSIAGLKEGGVREKYLKLKGFKVFVCSNNMDYFSKVIKEENIDLLHIHRGGWTDHEPIQTAYNSGVKVIIEKNTFGEIDNSADYDLIDHSFFISKTCYLDYISKTKDFKDFQIRKNKASVLYNPIEFENIQKYVLDDSTVRKKRIELGITKEKVIGRIGRDVEAKFGDILIDMFPHLLRMMSNVVFVMVGLPEEKRIKIRKLNLEKHFIFLDPVADPAELYSRYCLFDVFVHSARIGESFGNVIAEAMCCGKPVVTNSTPDRNNAQVELVDHGITGYIANYPEAYAEAVYDLLNKPSEASKMGERGKKKAKEYYNGNKITKILEKWYIETTKNKGIELDKKMLDYAKEIEYSPNLKELNDFEREYKLRLNMNFKRNILKEKAFLYKNKVKEKFGI